MTLEDDSPELDLVAMRGCFDGVIPPVVATCGADGRPNVTHLSQLTVVDARHIALSNQFFAKTAANVRANPVASVLVTDSQTLDTYRLDLRYLRTETEGPVFDGLRASIEAIGALVHMEEIFSLRGADIYALVRCECLSGANSQ